MSPTVATSRVRWNSEASGVPPLAIPTSSRSTVPWPATVTLDVSVHVTSRRSLVVASTADSTTIAARPGPMN